MTASGPHPLAIRDFRFYWVARLASTIGQMSMVIVIGWQVYDIARRTMDLHHAALQLGLIGVVQFVPLFVLTLVTGWTADRLDRGWVSSATPSLEIFCPRAPALTASRARAASRAAPPARAPPPVRILFSVAAELGVARAFAMPPLSAASPNLVPR